MLGSAIGGIVIGIAGVTLAHALEHPASGLGNITHGQGLAALTPAVINATSGADRNKFGRIPRILGGFSADDCALRVKVLLRSIGLDVKLLDLGLEAKDILWMVENCQKVSAANLRNTQGEVTHEMLKDIHAKCI